MSQLWSNKTLLCWDTEYKINLFCLLKHAQCANMLMLMWNHLHGTQDQPLCGQSKYSLYVGKCDWRMAKRVPCEYINYGAMLCTSSTMDPLKSFAVRAWLRFGAEGIDSTGASLGAFVRNGSMKNKLLELCTKRKKIYKYMCIIYIVGGIVLSISSTRGLRASRLGTALFFGLWISLFFHGICRRRSSSWGFEVRNGSTLTYSF